MSRALRPRQRVSGGTCAACEGVQAKRHAQERGSGLQVAWVTRAGSSLLAKPVWALGCTPKGGDARSWLSPRGHWTATGEVAIRPTSETIMSAALAAVLAAVVAGLIAHPISPPITFA